LNRYPKLRSVLYYGLKNFDNVAVEWVPGAAPTAYFYDGSGIEVSQSELGDRTLTELMDIFKEKGFEPHVTTNPYSADPEATREYGGHTYHFFSAENPLSIAEDQARKLGGYIATITSALEHAFLGESLNELKINKAWLGAGDHEEEGEWKYSGGSEKDTLFFSSKPDSGISGYSNWFGGEPNDADSEDCSTFFPDGWNDVSCLTEKAPLVVEVGNEPLVEPLAPPTRSTEPIPVEETKSDL